VIRQSRTLDEIRFGWRRDAEGWWDWVNWGAPTRYFSTFQLTSLIFQPLLVLTKTCAVSP
jgi:hypothetical protein